MRIQDVQRLCGRGRAQYDGHRGSGGNKSKQTFSAHPPDRHPGRLLRGGGGVSALLVSVRALPPAGPAPDLQSPELLRQVLLALALSDESLGGAEAAEVADRALELTRADASLDAPAALEAAKRDA
jgi:hypothetical protein